MKIAFIFNKQREKSQAEAEFDTPEVIEAIKVALESEGDQVVPIEMTRDGGWVQKLAKENPDIAFNTAEGFYGIGRESLGPIVFEQLRIPYVGSGPYCCFLSLDKFLTKQVVANRGVAVPEGYYISDLKELNVIAQEAVYPVFVKPNFEGSSKGITPQSLCRNEAELRSYAKDCLSKFPQGILIERFIEGKDVTVPYIAGLGDKGVLSPIEYVGPKQGDNWIYDYDLKNVNDDQVGLKCPADISDKTRELMVKSMKRCVQALAVVDMGRADFRVTPSGELFFIEFNALPSLQPGAGIFEATRELGLTYNETIQKILSAAIERRKLKRQRVRPERRLSTRDPKVALVYNLKRKTHHDEDYEIEAEFDSQSTIDAIKNTISILGYQVIPIEATRDLTTSLLDEDIDVVFNIAEGTTRRGREAQVPAVCDLLEIEHTGSDATCLAVTLDKAMTTRLVAAEGILTPQSKVFNRPTKQANHKLKYPLIVKPNLEGTSKGVYDSSVVENETQLATAVQNLYSKSFSSVLVEEYIQGREFTVGVIGYPTLQIIGPMEIEFKKSGYPVYSFEAKQQENQLDNEYFRLVCPVDLPEKSHRKIKSFAKRCFQILGARDIARIDFRMSESGDLYFIEMNPLPGLSPGFSDLTIMGERSGFSYERLIESILNPAIRRWRHEYRRKGQTVAFP